MTPPGPRDLAASVRQRLLNEARASGQDFQRLLVRFGVERLLYRLSLSGDRDRLVLKGAMLFAAWAEAPFRSTGDLDLLAFGDDDIGEAEIVFAGLCRIDVQDDGLVFLPESVVVERTRDGEDSGSKLG